MSQCRGDKSMCQVHWSQGSIWKPIGPKAGIIDVQFTAGVTFASANGNGWSPDVDTRTSPKQPTITRPSISADFFLQKRIFPL